MNENEYEWQPAVIKPESEWPANHRFDSQRGNGRGERRSFCGKKIFVRVFRNYCSHTGEDHKELVIAPQYAREICGDDKLRICECQVAVD